MRRGDKHGLGSQSTCVLDSSAVGLGKFPNIPVPQCLIFTMRIITIVPISHASYEIK